MLSYTALKLTLYKWAHHFNQQSDRRYEVNELVNAAWCDKRIQKLTEIKFSSRHIKFSMIDYMRKMNGYKDGYKQKGLNHQCSLFDTETGRLQHNPYTHDISTLENKEVCNQLLSILKPKEKEILIRCVMLSHPQHKVAAELGVTSAAISRRLKGIITKLKEVV